MIANKSFTLSLILLLLLILISISLNQANAEELDSDAAANLLLIRGLWWRSRTPTLPLVMEPFATPN